MAGWGEARKLAGATSGAAAVAIGASARAGIPLAIDVARRALALEAAVAVIAARTAAIGADAVAVGVVSGAVDMARRGSAVEVARFALVAHARPIAAATVIVIIIAAACVQEGRDAEQQDCEGRESNAGSKDHRREPGTGWRCAQGDCWWC